MPPDFRSAILLAALWAAACATAAEPPAAPEPAEQPAAAAEAEPEPSLQERWQAPFAVDARGEIPAREPRPAPVRVEPAAPPEPAAPAAAAPAAAPATPRAAAPAPRATTTQPPRVEAVRAGTHTVAAGETFYGIANRYRVTPAAMRAANPDADAERIRVGQTLRIPAPGAAAAPPTRLPSPAAARTHIVVSGDTLFGIARRYGVSPAAIRLANNLRDDTVRLGQTLTIPAAP
jgi:LysM repeat protein